MLSPVYSSLCCPLQHIKSTINKVTNHCNFSMKKCANTKKQKTKNEIRNFSLKMNELEIARFSE